MTKQRAMLVQEFLIEPRAMQVKEFLKTYRIGRTTCYRLLKEGRLKSVQIGRRRLILRDSAEALLKRGDRE